MPRSKKVFVDSEIGVLKRVIVHKPDNGIARITPNKAEELLFDDIVDIHKMQEEHEVFQSVLKAFLGKENVIETSVLLYETLETSNEIKKYIIDYVVDFEDLPKKQKIKMESMANSDLADLLITGYLKDEDFIIFEPIPNFIFTRDIAVTINDYIVVTKAAKKARGRENILTRGIIAGHPIFKNLQKENKIINLNDIDIFPPSKYGEPVSVEGGDMMIINEDYLLIGCSERTTEHAIESLKTVLFEKKIVKNIVQINIPNERFCMHIDTVFTMIDTDTVVAFKPLVVDGKASDVIIHRSHGGKGYYPNIKDFFLAEINPNINFILSGNGVTPFQEREQWTDGCNLVAVRPGVGLTYDRNPHTETAFKDAGYHIISASDFLNKVEKGKITPKTLKKTIITLPSGELSRARGGSHCMTCPIERLSL